jgi:hypothetical protein
VTPERWQQIARVYQLAIERPPAARGALLADVCGEDSDLRREVESLLARGDARVLVDQPGRCRGGRGDERCAGSGIGVIRGAVSRDDADRRRWDGAGHRAHDTKLRFGS